VKIPALSLVCLLSAGGFAFAQQTPATAPATLVSPASAPAVPVPVPAAPVSDASGKYMLREGVDVNLKFSQALTSKTATEGDPVTLELVDDLKVGNVVVAKAGCKAEGEVTRAKKAGMMGQAGDLAIRLDYIKDGDNKIKLRGTKGKEGESGVTGAVVLTVLFGPIGLIKHGHNVEIQQGQALHAFVGDDISLPPVGN
jgi:hypothetical protein